MSIVHRTMTAVIPAALALAACGGVQEVDTQNNPCSVMDSEDDGFGGVTLNAIMWDDWSDGDGRGVIEWTKDARGVTLTVSMMLYNLQDRAMPPGTVIDLRLADDSIVTFTSTHPSSPTVGPYGYGVATAWEFPLAVDATTAQRLSTQAWAGLRVVPVDGGQPRSMPFVPSDSRTMQMAAACLAPMADGTVAPPATAPHDDESVTL